MKEAWTRRWGMEMAAVACLPGVWRHRSGGFVVRGHVKDPRAPKTAAGKTKLVEILKHLPSAPNAKAAMAWLETEKAKVRAGTRGEVAARPSWNDFAASVFETKVKDRTIQSEAGVEKWRNALIHVATTSKWAEMRVDAIRHRDLAAWRNGLPDLIWERKNKKGKVTKRKTYGPRTLNGWLSIVRVVWSAASAFFELPKNPMAGVEDFDTIGARTYTAEEPNALKPDDECPRFMGLLLEDYPHLYAFVITGLVLGQRPSTVRPLRRKGPSPDVVVDDKTGAWRLLIRQSHSRKKTVMDRTKTAHDQEIVLPEELVAVLRAHIVQLDADPVTRRSDLLFPSTRTGGLLSRSVLDKPFAAVAAKMKLTKKLTARAMRRTFQDLSRAARVEGVVAKAISGHATDAMRIAYSTAGDNEVRSGIAKVISLASRKAQVVGQVVGPSADQHGEAEIAVSDE